MLIFALLQTVKTLQCHNIDTEYCCQRFVFENVMELIPIHLVSLFDSQHYQSRNVQKHGNLFHFDCDYHVPWDVIKHVERTHTHPTDTFTMMLETIHVIRSSDILLQCDGQHLAVLRSAALGECITLVEAYYQGYFQAAKIRPVSSERFDETLRSEVEQL